MDNKRSFNTTIVIPDLEDYHKRLQFYKDSNMRRESFISKQQINFTTGNKIERDNKNHLLFQNSKWVTLSVTSTPFTTS